MKHIGKAVVADQINPKLELNRPVNYLTAGKYYPALEPSEENLAHCAAVQLPGLEEARRVFLEGLQRDYANEDYRVLLIEDDRGDVILIKGNGQLCPHINSTWRLVGYETEVH